MNLHILIESNVGYGQDASVSGENYAFVFDGLGGTGAKSCIHSDGRKWKEAKVASFTAAEAVGKAIEREWEDWAQAAKGADTAELAALGETIRTELKRAIDDALQSAAREWNVIGGALPTTAAGWILFPQENGIAYAVSVWAGDSRCYTMDDQEMKLCTLDDVDEKYREDAMQELLGSGSAPMNNRAGINYEWHLNASFRRIEKRTLLLCCSDGIYGGMPSPMHMEYYLRLMADYETPQEMAQNWSGFFADSGFLQDDAATLEGIFFDASAARENEIESLREMLACPLDALEQDYIKSFPEEIDEETCDIDGMIGSLARQMCSKRSFHNTLKKNASDIVKKGRAFPDGLPCAKILRQMQEEYRAAVEEKRELLGKQLMRAQQELDEYAAGLDCGENEVRKERVELSGGAEARIRQNQYYEFLQEAEMRFNKIVRYMQEWYSFGMTYGMRRSEDSFDLRAISDLDDVMKDMCIFVNDHFGFAPSADGRGRLKTVRTGKAFIQRRREPLSEADQQDLKMTVRRMVESGETMDESLFENKSWSVAEVANLVMLTEKLIKAEREAARFEANPFSDKELSADAMEDYLKGHPASDARFFIEDWMNSKKKPAYFSLSEKDLLAIGRSVNVLMERAEENERIRERYEARRAQIMALWAQYKPQYEAWSEGIEAAAARIVPICEATAEAAEEADAEKLKKEIGEVSAQEFPNEEIGEAVGEADKESGEVPAAQADEAVCGEQTAAEAGQECAQVQNRDDEPSAEVQRGDAEQAWSDCESAELHE